jgi:hypothetical protein
MFEGNWERGFSESLNAFNYDACCLPEYEVFHKSCFSSFLSLPGFFLNHVLQQKRMPKACRWHRKNPVTWLTSHLRHSSFSDETSFWGFWGFFNDREVLINVLLRRKGGRVDPFMMNNWSAIWLLDDIFGSLHPSPSHIRFSNLCDNCRALFNNINAKHKSERLRRFDRSTYLTFKDVESSARQGCHTCHFHIQILSSEEKAKLEGCNRVTLATTESPWGWGTDSFNFCYFYPGKDEHSREPANLVCAEAILTMKSEKGMDIYISSQK